MKILKFIFFLQNFKIKSEVLEISRDIRFSKKQIEYATQAGLDTRDWAKLDEDGPNQLSLGPGSLRPEALTTFSRNWQNPASYKGGGLRIPFRFNQESYEPDEELIIKKHFNEISDVINQCIQFYDDTKTKTMLYSLVLNLV